MKFFTKVISSTQDFKQHILKFITKSLNDKLFKDLNQTKNFIQTTVIKHIKNQPEYFSLKSGELRNQFGLADTGAVDSVLSALDDIEIDIKKPSSNRNEIQASFIVNMIKDSLQELLSTNGATVITQKGEQLEWLRWLLIEGNNSVVLGYRYMPKSTPSSRTGQGIMVSGKSAIFRVPPEFAGTITDNWITRGVDAALPEIESYINRLVQKSL